MKIKGLLKEEKKNYLNLSGNQLTGQLNPILCTQINNWAIEGFSSRNHIYIINSVHPIHPAWKTM